MFPLSKVAALCSRAMASDDGKSRDQLKSALAQILTLNERIIEAVPGGVVHVAVDGSIRAANDEALRILGMRFDEITARYINDWDPETVWEDGTPCAVEDYPVTRALMTGESQSRATIGIRRPDGELAWAVFSAVPITGADGVVTGAVATFLDITERKRIEDALRESEAMLKSVVTSAPDIILGIDSDAKICFLNRTIESFEPEEVLGADLFEFLRPEDQARVRGHVQQIIEHGDTVQWEAAGLMPKDPNCWSVRGGPLLRDGAVVGATLVATNITEKLQAQEEKERLQAQLAEAQRLEAVGRLAGGIAHDFNNLLTVIRGSSDLLLLKFDGTDHAAALSQIGSACKHAALLTRQLLAFGRRQELDVRELDINHVILGIDEMLRRLVREDVELSLDLSREPLPMCADPLQLERVLLNLAANARDAMPEGGTLTIKTALAHEQIVLEVRDSGAGIDAETQQHIFEPFFTTKSDGTGLGLASVHGIVTQSGGRISVSSRKGEGTTFRIVFEKVDATLSDAPESVRPKTVPNHDGTILLVEDHPGVRTVTRMILEQAGYRVFAAAGGSDAIQEFGEKLGEIDLLVSDVVMPDMSGPKLAEALLEKAPGLRVLFVSGYADEEIRVRGLSPDEVRFLAKPYTPDELTIRVQHILDRED